MEYDYLVTCTKRGSDFEGICGNCPEFHVALYYIWYLRRYDFNMWRYSFKIYREPLDNKRWHMDDLVFFTFPRSHAPVIINKDFDPGGIYEKFY